MVKQLFVCAVLAVCAVENANAATIAWGAQLDNGLSSASGAELAAGSLIRLGYFNLSDSVIIDNKTNISFLNSNFIEAGTARIGDGLDGIASNFSASSTVNTSPAGLNLEGKQMVLWAFRSSDNSSVSSSINTALEIGIFYLANSDDWLFPAQAGNEVTATIDLTDLTNVAGTALVTGGIGEVQAKVLVGMFHSGASSSTGGPNFALAVVPEPATAGLAMMGGAALLLRRRRH